VLKSLLLSAEQDRIHNAMAAGTKCLMPSEVSVFEPSRGPLAAISVKAAQYQAGDDLPV